MNRCSLQGTSALHEACRHGQLKLCRLLLEAGGDLRIKNIYGIQSFFIAAQHGHTDIIKLLAGEGQPQNGSLIYVITGADVEVFMEDLIVPLVQMLRFF